MIESFYENTDKSPSFRYTSFPKISTNLISKRLETLKIGNNDVIWKIDSIKYSISNPPESYSQDNINFIIWLMCWKETYNYQNENEKPLHLIKIVDAILNKNIKRINIPVIIHSISSEITASSNHLDNLK